MAKKEVDWAGKGASGPVGEPSPAGVPSAEARTNQLITDAKETARYVLHDLRARLEELKEIYNSAGQAAEHITQDKLGEMPKEVLDSGLHAMIGTILHGIETHRSALEALANS